MSRVNVVVDFGEPRSSRIVSTKLLASAHSCAQLAQLCLEGLGAASNILLLAGAGAGLVVSCLIGPIIDRSLGLASNRRTRWATSTTLGSMARAEGLR